MANLTIFLFLDMRHLNIIHGYVECKPTTGKVSIQERALDQYLACKLQKNTKTRKLEQ